MQTSTLLLQLLQSLAPQQGGDLAHREATCSDMSKKDRFRPGETEKEQQEKKEQGEMEEEQEK